MYNARVLTISILYVTVVTWLFHCCFCYYLKIVLSNKVTDFDHKGQSKRFSPTLIGEAKGLVRIS